MSMALDRTIRHGGSTGRLYDERLMREGFCTFSLADSMLY